MTSVFSLLMLFGTAIVFLQHCEPETKNIHDVFSSQTCVGSCWLQLEPLITTREETVGILENQDIEYELGMLAISGDTFVLDLDSADRLIDSDGAISVFIEFFDNRVWRIWLLDTEICATDIINSYGVPESVVVTPIQNDFTVDIYYFDEGLAFFGASQNIPFIDSVFVTHSDFLRQYLGESETVEWATISNQYQQDCVE